MTEAQTYLLKQYGT